MRVRDIGVAIPSFRVDAETISSWCGKDPQFVAEKIGVASRAFLGPDETPVGLAGEACANLLQRNQDLSTASVGLLILVTQNPDYKLPHSSALLQDSMGFSVDTACFDVSLGCSGYVYALTIAKAFMASEGISDGIVVTCDPYSRIMARSDGDTIPLFGDAASATWLSTEFGGEIGRLDSGTDGSGAQALIVRAGGAADTSHSIWGGGRDDIPDRELRLRMDGRSIFNFMMQRIPASISRCLENNGLSLADVDYFVFHQASKFLLDNLRKKLGVEADRVPCHIGEVGNTVSSSIPLVLSRMADERCLAGKTVLISGFGVGLSWATNIIRF